MSGNGPEPLTFSGMTVKGMCSECKKSGLVGVIYVGKSAERITYLCRDCGRTIGLGERTP